MAEDGADSSNRTTPRIAVGICWRFDRAEALDAAIKDRRQIVLKLLEDAEIAFRSRAAQRGDHDQE